MLAFECLNFTLGGSLIRGLVRKLAIRHPQNQCKIFTLGGKPNSKFVPNSPHQLGNRGLCAASR